MMIEPAPYTGPNSAQLVRLLAADERRRVVAALVLSDEAMSPGEIADAAGLSLRESVDGLDRLATGGLVARQGENFELIDDAFSNAARTEAPATPATAHPDQPDDIAKVLDLAFRDGELVRWPSKRTKRLIVLDHMAQLFDVGVRYTEREVDATLRRFDSDVATMRRYLVDERFLDRGDGEYWRCGGSI